MGGVVDAVGGLFGVEGGESVNPLQYQPFNVQSALGTARTQGRDINAQLSPQLQGIYEGLLSQVQPGSFQPQGVQIPGFGQAPINLQDYQSQLERSQSSFGQTAEQIGAQGAAISGLAPRFESQARGLAQEAARQRDIARDPASALAFQGEIYGPELERQRLSQESRLLNQGLLGSTTGALQQEATRTAQNQALLRGAQQQQAQAFQQAQGLLGQSQNLSQLGLSARGQGLGATQAQLGAQQAQAGLLQPLLAGEQFGFGANVDFANQQFQQALAARQFEEQQRQQQFQRQQGLISSALGIGGAPLGLAELGGQFGARQLQADEGTAGLRQQADANQANFFSSLVGAGATAFASDARLKNNITPVGDGFYTWEWNDEAKRIGVDSDPTFGVIAQEVQKHTPEAVFESDSGYLMVDYSKVV